MRAARPAIEALDVPSGREARRPHDGRVSQPARGTSAHTARPTRPGRPVRDRPTLLLYAAMGVVGYVFNAWGSILGPLQGGLGVTRSEVAFYPSLFAAALIVIGVTGGRLVERTGHRAALVGALLGMLAGVVLLCTPSRPSTLAGAVVLGLGAALMVQVVPAVLARRQPGATVALLGEANAVSSVASVVAPASVATALGLGIGWRTGFLLPVLPVIAVLVLMLLLGARSWPRARMPDGAGEPAPVTAPGLEPGRLLGRWVDLVLAIGVEFCLVFWAADAFREWHGRSDAAATWLAAAFLAGMALTRLVSARLTAGRRPAGVTLAACSTAATGFAIFWASPWTAVATAGLLLTGMGIALLYPVMVARLVAAWPHAPDRAAARGALASGTAIGLAPLLLVQLAGLTGLRAAYLVVPALLLVLAVRAAGDRRKPPPS